jgi:aminopeptidase 2
MTRLTIPDLIPICSLPSLDVKKETSTLEFHSAALTLGAASVYTVSPSNAQKSQPDTSRSFESEQERCIMHFATPFPAGAKIQLRVAFEGELTGSMMGYYKSKHEHEGKTAYYALTQFEVGSFDHVKCGVGCL